jgi:hypothetical protein
MRAEVTQFLKAMASNDDADRRQDERISGNGATLCCVHTWWLGSARSHRRHLSWRPELPLRLAGRSGD